jgi:hypothetical protein
MRDALAGPRDDSVVMRSGPGQARFGAVDLGHRAGFSALGFL